MKTKILSGLLAAALGLTAQAAHSASITVDGNDTATNCTLAEAITSANNDTAAGNGCTNGSGADTITLATDVTLAAALPPITTVITIEGGRKTINGNNGSFSVLKIGASGNLTLNNAVVTGGNAIGDGGGIYNNGTLILNSCTVSGNTAGYQGGGIDNINGTLTLNNSAITANSTQFGGGIHNHNGTATVSNSTISGNTATDRGGGVYADAISVVILNSSTVSGNTAANLGGGLLANNATSTLKAALISGNSAATGSELYSHESTVSGSFNLFGHSGETSAQAFSGFTPGSSDVVATSNGGAPTALASILSPLADNSGPTQTHALLAGSPAIDLDATCSTGLTTDQRGTARPATGCDAGAYEYIAPPGVNLVPVVYELLLRKKR